MSRDQVPGSLQCALAAAVRRARASGALQPIATHTHALVQDGIEYSVRQVSSLAQRPRRPAPESGRVSPFLPYDPDLFVADVSATHVALLNKYPVIDRHLLIVTRAYAPQECLLGLADFEALWRCLHEVDGLAFYNAGPEAGASQTHKHLQLVPPAALPGGPASLLARLDAAEVARLPYPHAHLILTREPDAAALACGYRELLARLGIAAVASADGPRQSAPYNLLVSRRWMLAVPRRCESHAGISVNALGFAGSPFVKDARQLSAVREIGPGNLLAAVCAGP